MLKPPHYKNIPRYLLLLLSFPLINGTAYAGYSAVRVKCDENDTKTKIFINNKYKGECPKVDTIVPAGKITLRAQKQVDNEHEQVFVKQLDIVEGEPQRVNVELGPTQLTASAKREREQAAEKREKLAVKTELTAARDGDVVAMEKMAQRYVSGAGVAKSKAKADYWQQKRESVMAQADLASAKAGDIAAMNAMVQHYQQGKGVSKSAKQAQLWTDNIEAAQAQVDLASAKAGNTKAMKAVSQRYQTGKGLEQSTDQAQYWLQKVDETANLKLAEAKRREVQKEIDDISYIDSTGLGSWALDTVDGQNVTEVFLTGLPALTIMTAFDVISTPINLSRQAYLSQQLAARPSTWAKPDSMMAKAYQQQQIRIEKSEEPLLAAR
ncbi:hypothetical protein L4D76_26115 [Photobacterium sagamiensis]|uniref:tetratricopeptide repeat protein n=1 Tax=Photobacterium sagamiensis TaxID=2910241 RepID=UPI003D0A22A3